jgi:hypothetical protein
MATGSKKKSSGRGWHGDPEGHSRAARARRYNR